MTTMPYAEHDDYAAALTILPTLRPTAPNDDCVGMVGVAPRMEVARLCRQLVDAGYDVSDSRDDDTSYIWVTAR
jgi:hypothetical protein